MKIERLLSIIVLLLDKKTVSATILAEQFGVTKRTIYRDIETLELAGFPIISYPGQLGGYGFIDTFKMNKFTFTQEEKQKILEALEVQEQLLSFQTTNQIIKGKLQATQEFDAKKGYLSLSSATLHHPLIEKQTNQKLESLHKALINKQKIQISYITGFGDYSNRIILPLELLLLNGSWYLKAFCELRKGIRNFKITRIRSFTILDITYNEEIIQLNNSSPSDLMEIQLSFKKKALGKLYDFFLEEQMCLCNDRIIITFLYDTKDNILPFLLMFTNQVQVISPLALKNKHMEEIKKMQFIYQS